MYCSRSLNKQQNPPPENQERVLYQLVSVGKDLALQSLFHSHSHGNGSADHGVVAHAQKAHHFHVGRHGGGTGELGAAGGHGEVLLALLDALLLVGAGNRMLETKGAWLRMLRGGK